MIDCNISDLRFSCVTNHQSEREILDRLAQKSENYMQQVQTENIFKSATLPRIMTDRYDYQGDKPDTICVIDRRTGEPRELTVDVQQFSMPDGAMYEEYSLLDKAGEIVGCKNFAVDYNSYYAEYSMRTGSMDNASNDLIGVGARLDQIHVERAAELGIERIPRFSVFTGLLYHLKMGFLPDSTENDLGFTKISRPSDMDFYISEMNEELKKYKKEHKGIIPKDLKIVPIVVKKGYEYFLDLKQTAVYLGFALSQCIMAKTDAHKIITRYMPLKMSFGKGVRMSLSGEQLKHWQNLIKGHEILPKLTHRYI